jgi:hypothetical protein
MQCDPEKYPIKELVNAWDSGSLKINIEYQRGATWTQTQKQGLVDSVFRGYPLPPVFLHKISEPGLGGAPATRYEVVDGQQRIRAFADFYSDIFLLLKPDDKRLRLPNSLREKIPAPWGGRLYSQLDADQRDFLDNAKIDAFVLTEVVNPDEVRDLFIRLQSGTALNRQQVRDAWPGNLGPFVESLGGKLNKEPGIALFGLIDRRGDKADEDVDNFSTNRQVCAQLLTVFLARSRDPLAFPNISADDLDRTYHANTEFDRNGPSATEFIKVLLETTTVLLEASAGTKSTRNKTKYKKLEVLAVFLLMQDLCSNPLFKSDTKLRKLIADHVRNNSSLPGKGKATSGKAINEYYAAWRSVLPEKLGLHLDPKRLFDEHQKQKIFERDKGICQVCEKEVAEGDAEYDHYPSPHYLGGPTKIENGRLVCTKCHPRGRPVEEAL